MTFTEEFLLHLPEWAEILKEEPPKGQLAIEFD